VLANKHACRDAPLVYIKSAASWMYDLHMHFPPSRVLRAASQKGSPRFYAPLLGRRSLPPGIYLRLLLVRYFEGMDSEQGIAWRAGGS